MLIRNLVRGLSEWTRRQSPSRGPPPVVSLSDLVVEMFAKRRPVLDRLDPVFALSHGALEFGLRHSLASHRLGDELAPEAKQRRGVRDDASEAGPPDLYPRDDVLERDEETERDHCLGERHAFRRQRAAEGGPDGDGHDEVERVHRRSRRCPS